MRKPTISEIASHNAAAGGYYFSRETLKFFNQTLRSFKSYQVRDRIFVYAPANDERWPGYIIAEYFPATGKVRGLHARTLSTSKTDAQARSVIDAHCA